MSLDDRGQQDARLEQQIQRSRLEQQCDSVTGQEGRRFWGVTTISGNGEKTDEPFIGELTGNRNRDFIVADTDGYFKGELRGNNVLSFCYTHAGGKSESSVVSCSEVKRSR